MTTGGKYNHVRAGRRARRQSESLADIRRACTAALVRMGHIKPSGKAVAA